MNLRNYVDDLIRKTEQIYAPKEPADAFHFLTEILYEDPTPFQRVAIKVLYDLWEVYPPDRDEQKIIEISKQKWGIDLLRKHEIPARHLVLVLGRRSTKSTLASYLATYGAYRLICRGNPQAFYGIRERHDIFIVHIAASGNQAADVFSLTKNNIKKCEFFRPYIDFEKDNTTSLRLFTPYDLWLNEQIRKRNLEKQKGEQKENYLTGSITIKSVTTSASTHRGEAIYMLILSEFAHFPRAKVLGVPLEEGSSNVRTDYAVYTAMAPSVLDFPDGKIILESTPLEKGGEFYKHYCIAGGIEQDNPQEPDPSYRLIQLATWEARPGYEYEDFIPEFRRDPVAANAEWGAHFLSPVAQFMPEHLVDGALDFSRPKSFGAPTLDNYKYVISVDPGGKAKIKESDTYMVAWGHYEQTDDDEQIIYIVDGMQGWDVTEKVLPDGTVEKVPVDPFEVLDFIFTLSKNLGNRLLFVCYDQWQDQACISWLHKHGIPAIETTFTNKYKNEMYGTFLQLMSAGRVKICAGTGDDPWVEKWRLEMKYLQRVVKGSTVYFSHPTSGPVQHDDAADVVANLVFQLSLHAEPTPETMRNFVKSGIPIRNPSLRTVIPRRVSGLHSFTGYRDRFRFSNDRF